MQLFINLETGTVKFPGCIMARKEKYLTISSKVAGFFKDRGSKFHAFAYPVKTKEEGDRIKKALEKEFHDARHIVTAGAVGVEQTLYYCSDDGEPPNSSGPPVLREIKSKNVINVFVAVVRYFGGTKLGIPGLINAYGSAAQDALANAVIVEKNLKDKIIVNYEYDDTAKVMTLATREKLEIIDPECGKACKMILGVEMAKTAKIIKKLKSIQVDFELIEWKE
jgi:uncharacterized YigZ family protein